MNTELILILIIALSIAFLFTIETYSWLIKAAAKKDKLQVTSLSNIFLYFSRAFYFIFSLSVAGYIEIYTTPSSTFLIKTFIVGFFITYILHFFSLESIKLRKKILELILISFSKFSKFRNIELSPPEKPQKTLIKEENITISTIIVTVTFSISLSAPLLLILYYHEYRLLINNLSQIINFTGTFFLLYFVDAYLYKKMDEGTLNHYIYNYVLGRSIAFLVIFLFYLLTYFLI